MINWIPLDEGWKKKMCHLVNIAHHYWGEEDLREGDCHGVHGGHYGGVHEVNGVAVEEDCGAAHRYANDDWPENVLETYNWKSMKLSFRFLFITYFRNWGIRLHDVKSPGK